MWAGAPRWGAVLTNALLSSLLGSLVFLLLWPTTGSAASANPQPVSLQLKWTHQFQFAGYYAALERGYYREVGLDVTIVEGSPTTDVVEEVVSGRADFGVGTSGLLLDRAHGLPVVVVGVVYQHSPLVLLTRGDQPTQSVHALAGRRVMIEPHSADLLAMLMREQVPLDQLTVLPHAGSVSGLLSGEADATSAYLTDEPFALERAGVRPFILTPRAYGIDFYGDNFFTREEIADGQPDLVRRFREATSRGWDDALKNPEELVELILNQYPAGKSREHLQFEAVRSSELIQANLIRPGYMRRERWEHIADTYVELGMIPLRPSLEPFLFQDRPRQLPDWFWPSTAAALIALALFAALTFHFGRVNARLTGEMTERQHVQQELSRANERLSAQLAEIMSLRDQLREQAIRDPLTGLFNRRYLEETLELEVAQARRSGLPLSVVMLDVDHFKQVNDVRGHLGGDEALRALAALLTATTRDGDIVCRYGGDEVVLILPNMPFEAAVERADAWRRAFAETSATAGDTDRRLTISLGVAAYPEHGDRGEALLNAADRALYVVKATGRDRVTALPIAALTGSWRF